jgi:hypothetical protein
VTPAPIGPGVRLRCRMYLFGSRFYQLMAMGAKDLVNGPSADQFFDSFQLLPLS